MRTIYFDDKDIKESKIALANQKLTPLQSAFLMQYITNLEEQLQQKEDIINKAKEILIKEYKEDVFKNYQYDLYKAVNTLKKLLEILDNKGE